MLAAALAIASCASVERPPIAPAPAPPAAEDGGLVVSLTWSAPVDLDLYVTDPSWETLYFGNNPTRRGARLERDVRCATLPGDEAALERARIADALPGGYRVGVDFIDACGAKVDDVSFRVAADFAGTRREATGVIHREEFRVIALEFDLGSSIDTPASSEGRGNR